MENRFNLSERIGDIVSRFPRASEVFKAFGIDFCCGGNRPLSDAVREKDLKDEDVLQKLEEAYTNSLTIKERNIDWRTAPLSSLIDHIVDTHHTYLNRELTIIGELTAKILRVHGEVHRELTRVHRLFSTLRLELEEHLIKEEEIMFPLIKEYEEGTSTGSKVRLFQVEEELEDEHTGAGDILKELRKITNHYTAPEDGCPTYELTMQKLEALESDIFQHIHLENNVLFKRLQADL